MKAIKPSMRKTANRLGISPAYLSYMINGKRPWRPDLLERYTTIMNSISVNVEAGAQSGRAPAWGVGGRRFESDHPDQKKKRVVNTSIETSVNSSFRLTASPRLRDVLNSFIYSSAHKHQGANDFPADLYLEGMKGPPFIS